MFIRELLLSRSSDPNETGIDGKLRTTNSSRSHFRRLTTDRLELQVFYFERKGKVSNFVAIDVLREEDEEVDMYFREEVEERK